MSPAKKFEHVSLLEFPGQDNLVIRVLITPRLSSLTEIVSNDGKLNIWLSITLAKETQPLRRVYLFRIQNFDLLSKMRYQHY